MTKSIKCDHEFNIQTEDIINFVKVFGIYVNSYEYKANLKVV